MQLGFVSAILSELALEEVLKFAAASDLSNSASSIPRKLTPVRSTSMGWAVRGHF